MKTPKEILIRANESRAFLAIHGFLTDAESDRVKVRIEKEASR